MKCHFPDQALKIVITYLHWTGQTLIFSDGVYSLTRGVPDIRIIEEACRARSIALTRNGHIRVCGIEIKTNWDTAKTRRKVEDYLRKKASTDEIIRVAACLGLLK